MKNKVSFIICTDNGRYMRECQWYLNRLTVPEDCETELLTVQDAVSMTAGYNEAMEASDAKYKVYLHQDTFIRNQNFISDVLKIFQNPEIGMIGMVGTRELPNDGVMWNAPRIGSFYGMGKQTQLSITPVEKDYQEVMAVDGFLMATQYDLRWREDLFRGWDFYDASQCGEFIKAGYKIAVPAQPEGAWANHDCTPQKLWNYNSARLIFLKEYKDVFHMDTERIRVLQPYTKEIKLGDISWALLQNGYEPMIIDSGIPSDSLKKEDADRFSQMLKRADVQAVFTHDFSPFIAEACKENGIPYISWIYDAPLQALFDKSATYANNYIFAFDKKQCEWLKKRNVAAHIYYQPLATNVTRTGMLVIDKKDERRYKCDVSFVGQLYQDDIYQQAREKVSAHTWEICEKLIEQNTGCWDGINRLVGKLPEDAVEDLSRIYTETPYAMFHMDNQCYYEAKLLAHRIAYLERTEMLRELAGICDLKFYTWDDNVHIEGVRALSGLNYEQELPKVYYLSKININTTLHTIQSGVPLRVFDIMGCGGFMLTNYQPELEELFNIGTEIEVYHNLDELVDKVRYYLKHDRERIRIAMNGYQKVRDQYSYEKSVATMMQKVSRDSQNFQIQRQN